MSTDTFRPSVLRKICRNSALVTGGGVLLVMVLIAVLAPLIAPHDPYAQNLELRFLLPFWHEGTDPAHLLGTDHLGRDYLSRLIYGTRISLGVGFGVIVLSAVIGISSVWSPAISAASRIWSSAS